MYLRWIQVRCSRTTSQQCKYCRLKSEVIRAARAAFFFFFLLLLHVEVRIPAYTTDVVTSSCTVYLSKLLLILNLKVFQISSPLKDFTQFCHSHILKVWFVFYDIHNEKYLFILLEWKKTQTFHLVKVTLNSEAFLWT